MKVKVAVIQDSPIFFNKEKTLEKLESLVQENVEKGCELIVFPESFVPGYPRGFNFGTTMGSRSKEGRNLYKEYYNNSINLNSSDADYLENLSKKHHVYLVIGITEVATNTGSLYCSMVYISPVKGIMGVHRKIKPTGFERVIWAESDGKSLVTFNTSIGKMGGLICWENYMPLARMAIFNKGIQLYIAPTADSREQWTSTMRHIALEGRCFVLGCNQYITKSMYPEKYIPLLENEDEILSAGGSIIVSPNGEIIEGPLFNSSGALIAEIDLDETITNKLDFDVIGHYSRPDIFSFVVNGQPEIIEERELNDKSDD